MHDSFLLSNTFRYGLGSCGSVFLVLPCCCLLKIWSTRVLLGCLCVWGGKGVNGGGGSPVAVKLFVAKGHTVLSLILLTTPAFSCYTAD